MRALIVGLVLLAGGCAQVTEQCDMEIRLRFEYYGFETYCRLVGRSHELGELWVCITTPDGAPEWMTSINPVDDPEVFLEYHACVDSPLVEYREY